MPKQLEEHGLDSAQVTMSRETLELVVGSYTREAGVRSLDRHVATLARKSARMIVENDVESVDVTPTQAKDMLGPERFRARHAEETDQIGVATGLAVTGGGGDVLVIEAAPVPGNGKVSATGQLGDVMKESVEAAITYVRSRADELGLEEGWLDKLDVHVHVPEGAVPKDGPSAGITMTTALVSALTGRPVKRTVAMTGEVTLRGKVLPIGGVKQKVLAAHRAGIATVLLPLDNEPDLAELPDSIRADVTMQLVEHMDEVLAAALVENPAA